MTESRGRPHGLRAPTEITAWRGRSASSSAALVLVSLLGGLAAALWQAREARDQAGADDVTYHELAGAPHYLEGHRKPAMELVAAWIRERFE